MSGTQRLAEIDIVRGITIFLVVLGHVGFPDGLLNEIFKAFRMPLFFLVSGYLFSTSKYFNNTKKLVNDKTRTLLIPYICFGIIAAIISFLISTIQNQNIQWIEALLGIMYGNGEYIAVSTPLWFLVCMFCSFMLFTFVLKATKGSPLFSLGAFLLLGIIGYSIGKFFWLPLSFDVALIAISFMFLGHVLKERKILLNNKIMLTLSSIALVMFVLAISLNSPVDMNQRVYGNLLWFYIGGISGSILILALTKFLLSKSKIVYTVFSYLGKHSIIILGFHMIAILSLSFVDRFAGTSIRESILLTAVLAVSFSLLAGLVINRVPFLSFLFKGEIRKRKSISSISKQPA